MSNCKVGDLAIVVKSWAGHEGKIVRIVGDAGIVGWLGIGYHKSWFIDQMLVSEFGNPKNKMADFQLKPLRDNGGDDETLAWAGKPRDGLIEHCDQLVRNLNKIAEAAKTLKEIGK